MHSSMQTADMEVMGLGSEPARRGVRSALNCIRGVAHVGLEPDSRRVTVIYDAFRASPRQFETAVRVMGCEVGHIAVRARRAPKTGSDTAEVSAAEQIRRTINKEHTMHPIKYAVQNASTNDEVCERLTSFLGYLRSLRVDLILPERLSGLSACNADEVKAWSARLAQEARNTESLTPAGDLWLKELQEAFAAAELRLSEIAKAQIKQTAAEAGLAKSGPGIVVRCI